MNILYSAPIIRAGFTVLDVSVFIRRELIWSLSWHQIFLCIISVFLPKHPPADSLVFLSLRLCAVCHVSVATVTGEVPTWAGEAEGGVGESTEGGGRGGEEVPRGGVWMIHWSCFHPHSECLNQDQFELLCFWISAPVKCKTWIVKKTVITDIADDLYPRWWLIQLSVTPGA